MSPKTVSRVINDERYVAPDTKQRVRDAIVALGFQPNVMAKGLRLGNPPPAIGLIIGDLSNPFYSAVGRGVEEIARQHHRSLIVASSDERPADELQLVNSLLGQRIDGIIVVPAGDEHRYLTPALENGAQFVFLDRPPVHLETDAVTLDDLEGARRATEYLISRGHRRIGIVGDAPTLYTARERAKGYRQAVAEHGLGPDEELERLHSHTVDDAERAARELLALPDPVTAIFATNNRSCIGVLQAITDRQGGAQVDVAGFDDFELAKLLRIPLTVVSYNAREMGRRAAAILFERLGGSREAPRRVEIPTELVHYNQHLDVRRLDEADRAPAPS